MKLKSLLISLLASALLCAGNTTFAAVHLQESYSIKIEKLNVNLDNGKHIVDIDAIWSFRENPEAGDYIDSNIVISDIKKFLAEYPNKSDFWEVVNRNLTKYLIEKFKNLKSMTIKIDVLASKMDTYEHYSLVEATR